MISQRITRTQMLNFSENLRLGRWTPYAMCKSTQTQRLRRQNHEINPRHVCAWGQVRRALYRAAYFGRPESPVLPTTTWELYLVYALYLVWGGHPYSLYSWFIGLRFYIFTWCNLTEMGRKPSPHFFVWELKWPTITKCPQTWSLIKTVTPVYHTI